MLEPLAIQIRRDRLIQGVTIGNCEYKITQFADDLGFSRDLQSLRWMITTIQEYGECSGLKLNISKSSVMNLGDSRGLETFQSCYVANPKGH